MGERRIANRDLLRNVVLRSLRDTFGYDNVDSYEDDYFRIGVSLDGDIVDVHIGGSQ